MGRLANEMLTPIILKATVLLQEQGLMPSQFHIDPDNMKMTTNGQPVDLEFLSPLATLDDQEEAQKFTEFNQQLQQVMGPQLSLGALNVSNIPQFLANKMRIPNPLVDH